MLCFERLAGGHTTDQHVTEHFGFLKYLINADTVMANCWFNIAETVGMYIVGTPSPPFLKGGRG